MDTTQSSMGSDLNFTPYQAPTRGYSKATAELPQSNPLFMPQEQKKAEDVLAVSGVKQVWGK